MLRNIKIFFVSLAAVATMSSCLDKLPGSAIPEQEAMQSFNDAEQFVTGIYAMLKSSALYSGYLTLLPDIQTDLVYAVEGNTNTYGSFWQWDIRPTTSEIEAVYASLYQVISNCNFYLERVGDVESTLTDDDQIETLEQYTAEVYTIRALAYSELLKCYCKAYDPLTAESELGVVLRKGYTQKEEAVRASLKESYAFVLSDLDKAEELFAEENVGHSSTYMTLGVVYALRARVALNMQDWDAAVKYSSKVIDMKEVYSLSSAKTIYPSAGITYYDYMWKYDAGTEVLWRVGFTTTSYGGLVNNTLNFFINSSRNALGIISCMAKLASKEYLLLISAKQNRTESVAHTVFRDHIACNMSCNLNIIGCAC